MRWPVDISRIRDSALAGRKRAILTFVCSAVTCYGTNSLLLRGGYVVLRSVG